MENRVIAVRGKRTWIKSFQEACPCGESLEVWEGEARNHAKKFGDWLGEIFANVKV